MTGWPRITMLLVFMLVGCVPNATEQKRIHARIDLFKECMQLAATLPRQADDDVSDIVDSCSTQAFYMTRSLK
jgi:hypothetical protein